MRVENANLSLDYITETPTGVTCTIDGFPTAVPLLDASSEYQLILDEIIEHGADCFEGDVPVELQTAADAKLFSTQADDYRAAKARLERYQLSVGVPESTENISTGQFEPNEDTGVLEEVIEVLVSAHVEPLEPTTEVLVSGPPLAGEVSEEEIANPLIVADDAERAEAQAVIDATPTPVKEHVDAEE